MKLNRFVWVIILGGVSDRVAAVDSHCSVDELVVFNCSTGKNTVSICTSKDISTTSGYLQYRFGRLGAPEMLIPVDMKLPSVDIHANTLMFSGGGGAYIRFNNHQYSYVVYTAIGRGWGEKAGVVVEKNHQLQANLSCKRHVLSELGPDFFQQTGLAEDQVGFELP